MSDPTWADFVASLSLFREALACSAMAGLVLGTFSVHIVLRRMVFLSAALTQAAGLGVVLSFFAEIQLGVHVHPVLGALVGCVAAGVLVSVDAERHRLSREAVLAWVWLLASAGALLMGGFIAQEAHDIASVLFGTAVLVRKEDLVLVTVVGGAALGAAAWLRRALTFAGFDPDGARVQGVPVRQVELALVVLVTLVVAVCTRALGALPVFAFSVLPGLAALMLVPRLRFTFPVAGLLGLLAGLLGFVAAFFLELPVGASQCGVAALLVALATPVRLLRKD